MSKVIEFRLKHRASRVRALNWLTQSAIEFPALTEAAPIGANAFNGWRFVLGTDGVVYFANCIDQGITEVDLRSHKAVAA